MLREIEEINLKEKEHISLKVARKASWNSPLHFGEWVDLGLVDMEKWDKGNHSRS